MRSTIDLGRNLGLEVVAEGVETEETWDRLKALGCTVAQGYYLSRTENPALAGLSSVGAPRFELGTSSPPD